MIFSPFLHLQFGDRNIDVEQPVETHETEFKIESIWGFGGFSYIYIRRKLQNQRHRHLPPEIILKQKMDQKIASKNSCVIYKFDGSVCLVFCKVK